MSPGVSEVDWVVHIGPVEKNDDGLRAQDSGARKRRRSDMGLGKEIENLLPNAVVYHDIRCSPDENQTEMADFQPRRQP